jgi:Ni,Fe-hydrogenase III small subunit
VSCVSPGVDGPSIDLGKCVFCRECVRVCPKGAIEFTKEHSLCATDRNSLVIRGSAKPVFTPLDKVRASMFRKSLRLRQVSAGGCAACELDTNVLNTLAWDLGRFGIQFVASPRHADGLLITGPVTENMALALKKTYAAVPEPKLVISVGSCAISGGLFRWPETESNRGADVMLPIDLYIPGCPPHPLTILDGLLRLIGRIK